MLFDSDYIDLLNFNCEQRGESFTKSSLAQHVSAAPHALLAALLQTPSTNKQCLETRQTNQKRNVQTLKLRSSDSFSSRMAATLPQR